MDVRGSTFRQEPNETYERARDVLEVGELQMNVGRHEVTLNGQTVDLTLTEFELLRALMEWPGFVFTRAELIKLGPGDAYRGTDRTLDSHIKNLRRKIASDLADPVRIDSVYGIGYRLVGP